MSVWARSALALVAASTLYGAMLSPASAAETFSIAPGSPPYTTAMDFYLEGRYRYEISGTIVETDEFGRQSVFSAYHCIFGFLCDQEGMDGPQYFLVYEKPGDNFYLPQSQTPVRRGDSYAFTADGHGSGRPLTFAPIPFRQGNPQGQGTYSGDGFSFKITALPVQYSAIFGFHLDGFPDAPKEKYLPENLVGVELETSKTEVVTDPRDPGLDPFQVDTDKVAADGTIEMTTSYLKRTTQVSERKIRLRILRGADASYSSIGQKRSVTAIARVTESKDRHCSAGAEVEVTLTGTTRKTAAVGLTQEKTDGGRSCLVDGKQGLIWTTRKKFKDARIGYLFRVH